MTRALLLIDFQTGFDAPGWGGRNNPGAEAAAGRLLAAFRDAGRPVIHLRHESREPGSPLVGAGTAFRAGLEPRGDEPEITKHVNSALIGTDLEARLRAPGVAELVICGMTTPHCVSTTCRMAANLGFAVTLPHDACAAFAANADTGWAPGLSAPAPRDIHDAAVSALHGEFVTARPADAVIAGMA